MSDDNKILVPLKIDLQISSDALDSYLLDLIHAAQEYIKIYEAMLARPLVVN